MAFVFPDIKEEVFQKTFLKNVHVSFCFREASFDAIKGNALLDFFRCTFRISDINDEQIQKEVVVTSADKLIQFHFSLSSITLKMDFPAYKSFSDAQRWIIVINKYITILGVEEVEKMTIWKHNELKYSFSDNNKNNVAQAMRQIFSDNLLNDKSDGKGFAECESEFSGLSRWEKKLLFDDQDDTKSVLTIEYGFRERPELKNEGVLTMKTYIESSDKCKCSEIEEKANYFNKMLDCAFQWCINPAILTQMRQK